MTPTSTPAPPITPCPVSWCERGGTHSWPSVEEWGPTALLPVRWHTRQTLHLTDDDGEFRTVSAEVYEPNDGPQAATVEVIGGMSLRSPEEVEQLVAAVREAATIAFPPNRQLRDAELEWSCAIQEVVDRAGTPGNRADAAAIRLRAAQDALNEARAAQNRGMA